MRVRPLLFPIVRIVYRDHFNSGQWQRIQDAENESGVDLEQVGFLLKEDAESYTIASEICRDSVIQKWSESQVASVGVILKKVVLRIDRLSEAEIVGAHQNV